MSVQNIQVEWKPKASLTLITVAVMLATFVEVLNTSIANVALKTIAGSFSISNDESLWIVTLFLIASSILLPTTDWCCSVIGRKKFLLFCIALFGTSAFICGIAPNFEIMLIGRIFQGLGGGCLLPLSQAILLESYPKSEHGKANAIFGFGVTVAPILGPIIGGWLTTNYSWNWVFFISLPFCIAAFIMVMLYIEDPPYIEIVGLHKIDYIGLLLLIVWIASFQVMVDNGQKNGWFDSAYIQKLGITSLISFVLLIWWELKTKNPLLDLKIFKNWNYTFGTGILTVVFGICYGSIAILPMFLQSLLGYDAYLSGLAAGPMGVGSFLGIITTGILATKVDLRKQSMAGILIISIGCLMFSSLNLNIAITNVILPNIIVGFGMTFAIVPTTTLLYSNVLKQEMTNASSLQNLVKNVGSAVGTSSVGFLVSRYSQIHQNYLVDNMTMLNSAFLDKFNMLTANFMQMGNDIVTAQLKAGAQLQNLLLQQSTLSAFMSAYKIYAIAIIIILPAALILKKVAYK
ncbi:DHA2 family efflux MFS transporter permease subunit [bacterium]|nr:DHA2 family efflux MFS transporter permease subunit [bacterium]